MTHIGRLSLGVQDDKRAAAFWERALGYVRRAPRFEDDDWIVLEPPAGVSGMAIALDVSAGAAEEFPRVHLDLDAGTRDLDEEVERLVALGARRVDWPYYPEELEPGALPYVVLADTEGNRFCVEGRRAQGANESGSA
ncbi:VOC family protein [Streptomyces sp. TRM66268-LWL]|uniref:VOC family protein n=1 Tax=Streptomyces polyasparticus TaxID=2767826 RepID=A0ABR7SJH4_9ACTN|nr:VOC family protein [Streptomyces polyasparticus]MBC9715109.1 VOC family protein [Streptomyces polyasparticus]